MFATPVPDGLKTEPDGSLEETTAEAIEPPAG